MAFQATATRLWKKLSGDERLGAARHFWREPPPEVAGAALSAIAAARRMRPQAARALTPEARARALAALLDPGESVAAALLVALHLGERRALLAAFLDALGLAHDDGVLRDDGPDAPLAPEAVHGAARSLGAFPRAQVETYLNALGLQDPERWGALAGADEWL